MISSIETILENEKDKELKLIGEKIINQQRLTPEDGLLLFERGSLSFLGALANHVRERMHGDKTFFLFVFNDRNCLLNYHCLFTIRSVITLLV